MVTAHERQTIQDETYLSLLPIGYWVSAGFWTLYALFMVGYFALIGTVLWAVPVEDSEPVPSEVAWFFLIVMLFFLVLMVVIITSRVLAGVWISKREHRVATMVVAAITCIEIPYGTLLGVATFLALGRPSMKALYGGSMPYYASASPAPPPLIGPGGGEPTPQRPGDEGGVSGTSDTW